MNSLVVMRCQPLHNGHIRLIKTMLEESELVVICLGSTQEYGTSKNPFTFDERKEMIRNYFQDDLCKLSLMGLRDISDNTAWAAHVMQNVRASTSRFIDRYYGGSAYDCHWGTEMGLEVREIDRNDQEFPFVSASMIRDMLTYGDTRWRMYVPACNHELVATKFNRRETLI